MTKGMVFNMNLIDLINENFPKMSKGQKKIAEYILLHYDKAVFMTASRMGSVVGVSESTVVRFATLLGFDGYPKLQQALEELVSLKLSSVKKIEVTSTKLTKQEILENVIQSDIDKLKFTLDTIDKDAFEMAINILEKSRRIYICGIRSCMPLANFLGFYLNMIYDNVTVINTNSLSEIFEQMLRIDERDCFLGISFPRYSMRTLKAMEFANNRNAKVISITDSVNSPMGLYSSCNLLAKSELASVVDSLVAPLSVINAIIVSLFVKNKELAIKNMEDLEMLWEDYQVYSKDDINMVNDGSVTT